MIKVLFSRCVSLLHFRLYLRPNCTQNPPFDDLIYLGRLKSSDLAFKDVKLQNAGFVRWENII